jgi:molybdate transport system ATP-binding protein
MIDLKVAHRIGALALDVAFSSDAHITALFGRSGAGKTTLINIIAGLTRPDSGRIVVDGEVLLDRARGIELPPDARRIGYVFQEGRLFPHMTVKRNLLYGQARARHAARFVALEQVVALLGLEKLLPRHPTDLSGGEKQRVAIGRALLAQPRLLLFDEPLASLDAPRKSEILRYLIRLRDETRVPMVYVSHAVEEVLQLADQVVLLADGRVLRSGTVEAVMGQPDAAADGLFEGGAVIEARVDAIDADGLATLGFDGGELTVGHTDARAGDAVRVRIRARDVSLALEQPRLISIQNILRGTVAAIDEGDNGVIVAVALEGAAHAVLRSRITPRALRQLALRQGMPVYALVKAISLERR